jgi:hypothetical protein
MSTHDDLAPYAPTAIMSTGGDFAPGGPAIRSTAAHDSPTAIRFAAIVDAGGAILADSSPPSRSAWWLLAATPAIVMLTHYAAVLPHEFGHSFMARITGVKSDPWDIE